MGAYLARAGHNVLFVDTAVEHVARIDGHGLTIMGPIDSFTVPVRAVSPAALEGVFERIVLAVKTPATRAAVGALMPHLASEGFVVSAQNGLNEHLLADLVGVERTMGCCVNFGAESGRVHRAP